MITALSLSPAVDRIYMIENFTPGSLYRVGNCLQSAGGKGINVSRVLKTLGARVRVLGFKAGHTGHWLEKSLEDLGAETDLITVEGQSRTNNNIIDKVNGLETEILEEGPTIDNEAWEVFLRKFRSCLRDTKVLVCSGGLPSGLGADTYACLIREAGEAGVKTILDSSGEVLKQGVEAGPYLIKPNLKELCTYFNRQLAEDAQIVEACREILKKGVSIVVISLGERGALLVSEEKVLKAHPVEVKAVNTIGSGDSMVAGISLGLAEELPLEECFRLGCACAASNTEFIKIGVIDEGRVERLKREIAIYEL